MFWTHRPIEKTARARRTFAAARVQQRRREREALFAVRGWRASRSDTRAASVAFERMHNTLSQRVRTKVLGGMFAADPDSSRADGSLLNYELLARLETAVLYAEERLGIANQARVLFALPRTVNLLFISYQHTGTEGQSSYGSARCY